MIIELHILHRDAEISAVLIEDGWSLDRRTSGHLHATHRAVGDEPSARLRLDKVGLLISSRVRIRFSTVRKSRSHE